MKFVENWGGKLDWPMFTTIRLADKKEYYEKKINDVEPIFLKGKHYCDVTVQHVVKTTLNEINAALLLADTGQVGCIAAYKIFERFYKNKKQWKGYDTEIIVIFMLRTDCRERVCDEAEKE